MHLSDERLAQRRCVACGGPAWRTTHHRPRYRSVCQACHAAGLAVCGLCRSVKPRTAFHRHAARWSGLQARCRACLGAGRARCQHPVTPERRAALLAVMAARGAPVRGQRYWPDVAAEIGGSAASARMLWQLMRTEVRR